MMKYIVDAENAHIRSQCSSYFSKNFNKSNHVLNSVWNEGGGRRSQLTKSQYEQLWRKRLATRRYVMVNFTREIWLKPIK